MLRPQTLMNMLIFVIEQQKVVCSGEIEGETMHDFPIFIQKSLKSVICFRLKPSVTPKLNPNSSF